MITDQINMALVWNLANLISKLKVNIKTYTETKIMYAKVYANYMYISLSVMTNANSEGFPVCDERITENDRCVIKIIGIHCQILMFNNSSKCSLRFKLWWQTVEFWSRTILAGLKLNIVKEQMHVHLSMFQAYLISTHNTLLHPYLIHIASSMAHTQSMHYIYSIFLNPKFIK